LGLWLAHEHPEPIYAYVGVGQVVDMHHNEEVQYQDALQEARDRDNEEAVKELVNIAPYPPPNPGLGKFSLASKWAGELLGPPPSGADFENPARFVSALVTAPEYSLADDFSFFRGMWLSTETLFPGMMKIDLNQLGYDFSVPIFFLEGKHDQYCRPSSIWEYSQTIKAPQKEFVWSYKQKHKDAHNWC
jgi:pimeloyl-ACP methyl ester carboxylesterase